MFNRTILWYLLLLTFVAANLSAQLESRQGTWDTTIIEKPAPIRETPPLEWEVFQVLTQQQIDAYVAGTPPAEIVLSTGETLEALLNLKISTTIDASWYSVDGGGGMMSTGGQFSLGGTIGQPDAGWMTGGQFVLRSGFWAAIETDVLVVIPEISVGAGEVVDVPIVFESSGFDISAAAFSIDFDESCLDFDPTDADLDGNPDSISFSLPLDFTATATYDAGDLDGELDFTIVDPLTPLATLPDADVATITFTTTCQPVDTAIVAPVVFSDMPPPTFGDTSGQDVPGRGVDGSVSILPGTRGDCNDDDLITAGDLSACVLEVFDGDGDCWLDVPGGTFEGSPIGCDANADEIVNAGDLSCKILLIFDGPGACGAARRLPDGWGRPILSMDIDPQWSDRHAEISVPVYFRPRGWSINSLVFSVDYDERAFTFDPSDKDGDGIPDAIKFELPGSTQVTVSFDRADTDGELDVSILDPYQMLDPDSGEALLSITLKPLTIPLKPSGLSKPGDARVRFSRDPGVSFGDLSGRSVEGSGHNGRHQ